MKKTITAIMALLLLAWSSTISNPVVPMASRDTPKFNHAFILRLRCQNMNGTAVAVGDRLLTASHVTKGATVCTSVRTTNPRPSTTLYPVISTDVPNDVSFLKAKSHKGFALACRALEVGEPLWFIGYPGGQDLRIEEGTALSGYQNSHSVEFPEARYIHQRKVRGHVYAGMSGGAVLNSDGEMIAYIVSVSLTETDVALVKEIIDTPLCGSSDK